MKYEAYWISPRGRIIPVTGQVATHIRAVIKNPAQFGLSRETVQKAYRRHQEPLGLEGKARQEIMAGLLRKGWVRLRFVPKAHGFTIQTGSLKARQQSHLRAWARKVTNEELDTLDAGAVHLNIITECPQESYRGSLRSFLDRERPNSSPRRRTSLGH